MYNLYANKLYPFTTPIIQPISLYDILHDFFIIFNRI